MKCKYISISGTHCAETAVNKNYCYWHDDSEIKKDKNLSSQLSQWANEGKSLDGFKLRHSELPNINLVHHGSSTGYALTYCDFYHANLAGAHLFGADLSNSSLMKCNLVGANLHCANLENTNLLGVRLNSAKLEGIHWGERVLQEALADASDNFKNSKSLYAEAEEVYRHVGRNLRYQGLNTEAGEFYYREKVTQRKQLPLYSLSRLFLKFIDIYCGYGEKPNRLIIISSLVIGVFTLLYGFVGLQHDGQTQAFSTAISLSENVQYFLDALYFSIVTFTTLGYGDFSPVGISRGIASSEAVFGSFTIALFVVVFVRRLTQ